MIDRWFENAPMGQRARLLTLPGETGGRSFVLEYVNRPRTGRYAVPAHVHPCVAERFEVLAGRARYRIGGEERSAEPGASLVFPPGVVHIHPWSDSDEELHVRQTAEAEPPDLAGLMASLQAAISDQERDDQEGHDVGDLDHRVDGRAGGVLVGVADGVAGDRGGVGLGALAAVLAVLDQLLGVVPGAAAGRSSRPPRRSPTTITPISRPPSAW